MLSLIITNLPTRLQPRFVHYMKHSWWTLADRHYFVRGMKSSIRNGIGLTFAGSITILLFLISAKSYGAEPVFEMQERSISSTLLPEKLPLSFYTFDPDEYWAEPEDSYWLDFSNFILRQERIQGPKVQALGQWADRTLSGEAHRLPTNDSYLRVGFATESEYGDPAQFEPEVRFRLDIPTTKRKLRLVIEKIGRAS